MAEPRLHPISKPFKSSKERVLDSANFTDSGRRVAEHLMKDEGLVLERLFNFLGDLEDRLTQLERSDA
jgi:hypothetical protein